jgi:DNA gyrase subunit A
LKSEEAMRKQVSEELTAVSKAYAVPRRTAIGKE